MPTTEKPTTQLELIPTTKPTAEACNIALDLIDLVSVMPGPPPSETLKRSVNSWGVLVPVIVTDSRLPGVPPYRVVDGRRRVKAAMVAGLTSVPTVYVSEMGELPEATLSAMAHATRSANQVSDLNAIVTISRAMTVEGRLNAGEIVSEIAKKTGLSVGTVKSRLLLLNLPAPIRNAIDTGKVSIAVAEQIVRLDGFRRQQLVEVLAETGKITPADVKAVKQADAKEAAAAFDWGQIDDIPGDTVDPEAEEIGDGIAGGLVADYGSPEIGGWERVTPTVFRVPAPTSTGFYRITVQKEV
jgi:ParB/RepB/Spo0J family partition protein